MSRKEKLLRGLDVRHAIGVEIGPLASPLVDKQEGTVYYVDYADADFLRNRYKNDPKVDVSKIVPIDAIWGKKSLNETLDGKRVDYVIASHVIEHVPDLVTWLDELHSVLTANGTIRVVVPDRRYSFDYLRQESRLSDVLTAYAVRARVPQPHEVLDCCLNQAKHVDTATAWRHEIDVEKLEKEFTFEGAMWLARDIISNGTYHDIHCWVFTPASFAKLCCELAKVDLLTLACDYFVDTAHNELEFYVGMKPAVDRDTVVRSWQAMYETCK